ncbi:MAG TPA: HIT domain-containing protein [Acidimicrobiia bacterium]
MTLDRLWAGWRSRYVSELTGAGDSDCFLCALEGLADDALFSPETLVLERTASTLTVMNLYPYGSGHLLVAPRHHEADLEALSESAAGDLMSATRRAVRALKTAYTPDGVNVGINLGVAAGAGVPGHLHVHALPRWGGDTNFMTSVAEVRVLPEDLATGWAKLRAAWPPS